MTHCGAMLEVEGQRGTRARSPRTPGGTPAWLPFGAPVRGGGGRFRQQCCHIDSEAAGNPAERHQGHVRPSALQLGEVLVAHAAAEFRGGVLREPALLSDALEVRAEPCLRASVLRRLEERVAVRRVAFRHAERGTRDAPCGTKGTPLESPRCHVGRWRTTDAKRADCWGIRSVGVWQRDEQRERRDNARRWRLSVGERCRGVQHHRRRDLRANRHVLQRSGTECLRFMGVHHRELRGLLRRAQPRLRCAVPYQHLRLHGRCEPMRRGYPAHRMQRLHWRDSEPTCVLQLTVIAPRIAIPDSSCSSKRAKKKPDLLRSDSRQRLLPTKHHCRLTTNDSVIFKKPHSHKRVPNRHGLDNTHTVWRRSRLWRHSKPDRGFHAALNDLSLTVIRPALSTCTAHELC